MQRSLFADVAGPCPSCGHALRLIDLSIVGFCDACGGDFWRDDERSPWESTDGYFASPGGRGVPVRSALLTAIRQTAPRANPSPCDP
ncbi:MAG: hypothetical protein WBC44_07020 [Planctomycetaceae bacterium]